MGDEPCLLTSKHLKKTKENENKYCCIFADFYVPLSLYVFLYLLLGKSITIDGQRATTGNVMILLLLFF